MTAAAHPPEPTEPIGADEPPDSALLTRARAGDAEAVAALFERYHPVALALATRHAGPDLAPDIAATAFERILRLLRQGKGPTTAFRPYLAATVNSAWVDHVRRDSRLVLVEDDDDLEPLVPAPSDGADDRFDRATVAAAFADLPPRWQHVLWHTAVEGMAHDEVGEALGLTGNAVGVLAHRAREGLRTAYLDAHLAAAADAGCRRTTPLLGAYVRGAMSVGKRQRVTEHLADCARCRHAVDELGQISANLGAVLLPLLGLLAASGLPGAATGTAPGPGRSRTRRHPRRTTQVGVVAAAVVAVALAAAAAVLQPWAGSDAGPAIATAPSAVAEPGGPDEPDGPDEPGEPGAPAAVADPTPAPGVPVASPAPGAPAPDAEPPAAASPGTTQPSSEPTPSPGAPSEPSPEPAPGPSPEPPSTDPAANPRFERSRLVAAPGPQPGWTRVTVPVVAASPGTVVTMSVRGAREVCLVGAGEPRCTTGPVSGWTVPALGAAEPLVVEVRHDALAWIGFGLEALDRPDDVPADNQVDAILHPGG
ncbi:sigma-70 family RNA polymerase sigma factor [Nocardioides zeae]|uniref:Sigma-70 family RNA polymerase sigma factor n=1 Tax=Nocardioides zeae TaxID=1457234 RepID=A0A6P0HKB1_9ACTN|nr:sigma-70 family RNA polymerase sigma factor [Nocardioides zeae]NEN79132.1 sigma-70 family RNA polymerase sigma factor [Nocardioides zeae]